VNKLSDIPAVILAGGKGSRLAEETYAVPKPMVEIGDMPILLHIMHIYAAHGVREFVICAGHKGNIIKDFFLRYSAHKGSLTVNLGTGDLQLHGHEATRDWLVHVLDTGPETMTGGRIKRAAAFLEGRRFFATYGDGVSSIDIDALYDAHVESGGRATLSAVRPPARFGNIVIDAGKVRKFEEKPQTGEGWINGGFMVMEPTVATYLDDDSTVLEHGPLERLANEGELTCYQHEGFWQCMDTVRDMTYLRSLWNSGKAPWKCW
jgi:glucose-1-phosphate cytidylyltransferase